MPKAWECLAATALLALLVVGYQFNVALADEPRPEPTREAVQKYPPGPLGELVRIGEAIVKDTPNHPLSKPYSGNALSCTSCHLDAGRNLKAASFVGVATAYPAYAPREKRVITLEDRVLNCFMRSCNGTRPPLGSKVSVAITAYITWLSQDQPLRMNPEKSLGPNHIVRLKIDPGKADPVRGRELYGDFCAECHGREGQGLKSAPPVWGPNSYNAGAGLSRLEGLASWLKVAMPLDDPFLEDDEARDIAAYVVAQPRPRFVLRDHLPPPDQQGTYNSEILDEVSEGPAPR